MLQYIRLKVSCKLSFFILLVGWLLWSCSEPARQAEEAKKDLATETVSAVETFANMYPDNQQPSRSLGTVSNGSLENGKLMPFSGENFIYFDTTSYLKERAFLNHKVKDVVLEAYEELSREYPGRKFTVMECANRNGGKIFPHRTHQNGLSIDLMMPKIKGGKPYYNLDDLGASHYALEFDGNGRYSNDPEVTLDLELVAHHLLILQEKALNHGLSIDKVIIKTELKDELFAGEAGQELKNSSIYIVRKLSPMINALHDDHFHVDFRIID